MNKPLLETCLSPALLNQYDLKDTIVVIIDVFRATSTIAAALHNGAKEVIPIASVDACIDYKNIQPDCITAGERDGKVAPGLEYGNSPFEYPKEFIAGKTLVLTTTNGTKLLHMVKEAVQIITGSFLNLEAVCNYLLKENKKVLLGCAAWKDKVNMEDALFAGAVIHSIQAHFDIKCDASHIAMSMYQRALQEESLLKFLEKSNHYNRLKNFGLIKDLEYCTTTNLHPIVPKFDGKALKI